MNMQSNSNSNSNSNNKVASSPLSPPSTFPLSRRALIQKAKEIDPTIKIVKNPTDIQTGSGSYSTIGWSNRLGSVLTPASIPGVYTGDRPFIWNNIDVGCRMTVIQLSSSSGDDGKPDLFIHSPVSLDAPLISKLNELGTVKHVVSPNYEHVKYASQWADYYNDAYIWGCPGIMEKEPLVNWTGEIPMGCRPPGYYESKSNPNIKDNDNNNNNENDDRAFEGMEKMWDWNEIQPLHVDCERLPIIKTPFFSEVVFYHTPSKTLLVTDTYWNYPRLDGKTNANYANLASILAKRNSDSNNNNNNEETGEKEMDFGVWELAPEVGPIPFGSRAWKFGMDKVYRPIYLKLLVDKQPFQDICKYICDEMEIHTIIPAHGDLVRGKTLIRDILRKHFALE